MLWEITWRDDPRGRRLADRHYSRQTPGASGFTPPGRACVLVTPSADAVWVTSWPFAQYVNRVYPDAWLCCLFRNESDHLASDLILDAIAATRWKYGQPPPSGMVTMIDQRKVKPIYRRGCPVYGWTYRKCGFQEAGFTKEDRLLILRLAPEDMPAAAPPLNAQLNLWSA